VRSGLIQQVIRFPVASHESSLWPPGPPQSQGAQAAVRQADPMWHVLPDHASPSVIIREHRCIGCDAMRYRKNGKMNVGSVDRLKGFKASIGQSHQRFVYALSNMTTNTQSPSLRPCSTPGRSPQGFVDPGGHSLVREQLIRFVHR